MKLLALSLSDVVFIIFFDDKVLPSITQAGYGQLVKMLITLEPHDVVRSGPEVIKLILCSTQLSTKFILLINVKMPTIVGILSFISMINTTSKRLKARNVFICRYFSVYEQLKVRAQLS